MDKFITFLKKIFFLVILIFFILFVIGLIMPVMGRVSLRKKRAERIKTLNAWQSNVVNFVQERSRLPRSLHEIYSNGVLDDFFMILTVSKEDLPPAEVMDCMLKDPNLFNEMVEFSLFISQNNWFVQELKSDFIYPIRLMIDQDGKIYEIKEVPKEK